MSEKGTSQIPISPALLKAINEVLGPSETLAEFVEAALASTAARRQSRRDFVVRAMASRDAARVEGRYIAADDVLKSLEDILEQYSRSRR